MAKVYDAITTRAALSSWWAPFDGDYAIGGSITFRFGEDFTTMEIVKLEKNREVIWKCVDHHFTVGDGAPADEWIGTGIRFSLKEGGGGTTVLHFTHEGLTPELMCYESCLIEWGKYLDTLKMYIETSESRQE